MDDSIFDKLVGCDSIRVTLMEVQGKLKKPTSATSPKLENKKKDCYNFYDYCFLKLQCEDKKNFGHLIFQHCLFNNSI